MATKNMSEMDSYSDWSKVMLNDSKELRKKQSRNNAGKYSRRLFSKLRNSPTPYKLRSKKTFYQRYIPYKPKSGFSSQKSAPKTAKQNCGSEWKKEYDVWNMIVQALDQSLLNNHKVNWPNKVIGIRDSNDKIRLIQNRDELQKQILVSPNGLRTHLKDLFNADDSTADISLKMKFKLVPVVESIILVNKSIETPYTLAKDDNSIDINNNDMECQNNENVEVKNVLEEEDTLINFVNNHESTGNIICDKTLTNTSCSTWEYSEFCNDCTSAASSTLISDETESYSCLLHDKENIPLFFATARYVALQNLQLIELLIKLFFFIYTANQH